MSQWTHFLGVMRFDSMALNVWPEPHNKEAITNKEADFVHRIWSYNSPMGSEGRMEIKTQITNRGPTVLIVGDLRDFGLADLDEVLTWVNNCCRDVRKEAEAEGLIMFLRDGFVYCDVEFYKTRLIIEDESVSATDPERFYIIEVEQKGKDITHSPNSKETL